MGAEITLNTQAAKEGQCALTPNHKAAPGVELSRLHHGASNSDVNLRFSGWTEAGQHLRHTRDFVVHVLLQRHFPIEVGVLKDGLA